MFDIYDNYFKKIGLEKLTPERVIAVGELVSKLMTENISFDLLFCEDKDGFQVVFPNWKNRKGDVILHNYSYEHEVCLFEGYGAMSTVDGDVCVFNDIDEVVEMAKKQNFYKEENKL